MELAIPHRFVIEIGVVRPHSNKGRIMQQNRNSQRNLDRRLDIIHMVFCVLILAMAALAFINPEENMTLFPLVFFSAALLRLISGGFHVRTDFREGRIRAETVLDFVFGSTIMVIGFISAISIWKS